MCHVVIVAKPVDYIFFTGGESHWETCPSTWDRTIPEEKAEPDAEGIQARSRDQSEGGHIYKYVMIYLLRLYL